MMKRVREWLQGAFAVVVLLVSITAVSVHAQELDWPGYENMPVDKLASRAKAFGPGSVVGAYPLSMPYPVGLEHDGTGHLYMTSIYTDSLYRINPSDGSVMETITSGLLGNPIGVTTDGNLIYVTDTVAGYVQIYLKNGTHVGGFSVAAYTTFPEGITFCPNNGHLYVVNGSGWDIVMEYLPDGTFINYYYINGYSPDGIAWDPLRQCFWIYDSGTDTVRQYDNLFNQVSSFPGTWNAGYNLGEGLAVVGNSLFVVDPYSPYMVEFSIAGAPVLTSAWWCIESRDGSQKFTININNGQFDYVTETDHLIGYAGITSNFCALMVNGMANDGSTLIATFNLCEEPRGNVFLRSGDLGAPSYGGFIINGPVSFFGCLPE